MIIFYRLKSESPNMRKIAILLQELGMAFAVKYIEPGLESIDDADFNAISPTQTLPALYDSETGVALFESGAILQYLASKYRRFISDDIKQRAEAIKWVMFEAANLCPAMIELHHYILSDMGDLPDSVLDRYKNKVARYCEILDRQLQSRDYLAGEYSIADMAIYPWMVAMEDMAEVTLADYPNLSAWIERLNARMEQWEQPDAAQLAMTNWCLDNGHVKVCHA